MWPEQEKCGLGHKIGINVEARLLSNSDFQLQTRFPLSPENSLGNWHHPLLGDCVTSF